MNLRNLFLAAFLLPFVSLAQQKHLDVNTSIMQGRTSLAPKRLGQLQWITATDDFSYIDTLNKREVVYRSGVNGKASQVTDIRAVNAALRSVDADTMAKFLPISWDNAAAFSFTTGKKKVQFDTKTSTAKVVDTSTLPDGADTLEVSSNGVIAYVINNNVYVENKHKSVQVTTDGSYGLVYGKSVHRDEFGIDGGLFWSPNGTKLAFYRMDQSMVTDYPITDWTVKPAVVKNVKYPFAGEKSHEVTVGVYDVATGKTVYLKTGLPAEQYLTNVSWSPDEKLVYIAVLNRHQNHMWFNSYNSTTGDFAQTLFEETDPKYTEPQHPAVFVPGHNDQFIWQSRRDGYNHLYLYSATGKLMRQLTKGNWEVTDMNGFDPKGTRVFYHCTSEGGDSREFGAVALADGKMTRIATGSGMRTCIVNKDGKYVLDNLSSLTVPRVYSVLSTDGKKVSEFFRAENPVKDYVMGETKRFWIKSDLGDSLACRMVLPSNMDPTKKYPVIVYVYGGPHVQLVNNGWLGGAELWYHYMADKGYILFTLDNHGSGNRGRAFEQVTFRQLGTQEMKDQLAGIAYLKSQKFVDPDRIGVHGWSFGGFMTTSLMTRNPGVFKVGVAGGPVIDWSYYEIMYTERYMDTPQANKEGYDKANLLNYVDQLKGKLMLIHGTSDETVVWEHSLMYVKKAVSKGVQLDYFPYPGHLHNVLGKDRVHLMTKVCDYFLQNL